MSPVQPTIDDFIYPAEYAAGIRQGRFILKPKNGLYGGGQLWDTQSNCWGPNPIGLANPNDPSQVIDPIASVNPFKGVGAALGRQQDAIAVLQTLSLVNVGLGVVNVGLGVANLAVGLAVLHGVQQLRQEVTQLHREVRDGFVRLENISKQHLETLLKQSEVIELKKAYGRAQQAIVQMQHSVAIANPAVRNGELEHARQTLYESLGVYKSGLFRQHLNDFGCLQIEQCVWAIQQQIALTYILQNELDPSIQSLKDTILAMREFCGNWIGRVDPDHQDFAEAVSYLVYLHDADLRSLEFLQQDLQYRRALPADQRPPLVIVQAVPDCAIVGPVIATDINSASEAANAYERLKTRSNHEAMQLYLKILYQPHHRLTLYDEIVRHPKNQSVLKLESKHLESTPDLWLANVHSYICSG